MRKTIALAVIVGALLFLHERAHADSYTINPVSACGNIVGGLEIRWNNNLIVGSAPYAGFQPTSAPVQAQVTYHYRNGVMVSQMHKTNGTWYTDLADNGTYAAGDTHDVKYTYKYNAVQHTGWLYRADLPITYCLNDGLHLSWCPSSSQYCNCGAWGTLDGAVVCHSTIGQ